MKVSAMFLQERATFLTSQPKLLTLFFLLLCCIFGCGKKCAPPLQEDPRERIPAITNNLRVDIFLDATLSMKGFTTTSGTASYYQQTIPLLERAVIKGWAEGQAKFAKFGERVEPLAGRVFLDADKPAFYSDNSFNTKTLIENVVDAADASHLTVIVTDLFQDKTDINHLSDKLKTKFIAKSLAVGVVAVRSQFDGPVYDVGRKNYSFTYRTTNDKPETYRPFYILALGQHSDVENYFKLLDNGGLANFPATQKVIFSRYLTPRPATFEGAKVVTFTEKLSEVRGRLIPSASLEARVKEFKISGSPMSAKFHASLSYAPLEATVETGADLEPEIQAWKCDENAPGKLMPLIENPAAKNALKVNAGLVKEGPLYKAVDLKAEINPMDLPGTGAYCYRIILRPKVYKLPSWVSSWNMSEEQVEAWRQNPSSFDGSKTYNLESFLGTIWETTRDLHHPKIADVYCYIEREK